MIDVIIPAYNSHGTIIRTLSSIAMQLNRKELKITIVNDGGKVLHADTYEWHYNEALETINITCNIDRTNLFKNKTDIFQDWEDDIIL